VLILFNHNLGLETGSRVLSLLTYDIVQGLLWITVSRVQSSKDLSVAFIEGADKSPIVRGRQPQPETDGKQLQRSEGCGGGGAEERE